MEKSVWTKHLSVVLCARSLSEFKLSKRILITLLVAVATQIAGVAQKQKLPSYGKVSMEELTAEQCPIDSGAQAYYIFDEGHTEFVYLNTIIRVDEAGSNKGFQMKFERHVRIKILDKAASDLADFEIPLYERGSGKEQIMGLKGVTYNLENGKVVKTKLDSKQVITEQKDKNWAVVKFAMPEVREGSVIEVSYQVLSDFFFNLQEWQFQKMYPVLYSEYTVAIPQYYFYSPDMMGYIRVNSEKSAAARAVTLTVVERTFGGNESYSFKEEYREDITTFYANDVPAFKVEPYLRTPRNYISKVSFELRGTQFPRSAYENYSSSWEAVSKELMGYDSFGLAITRDGFLKEEVAQAQAKNLNGIELVSYAFERVKQKMNWNGNYRLLATNSLKQAWDDGSGSSADINLTLVTFLKSLNIEAYPVAVSTRGNGIIPISHPSLTCFNYVVAMAVVDGKKVLLDSTEPFAGINQLPERCLNDNGRVIGADKSEWISLTDNAQSYQMFFGSLTLNEEGDFTGNIELVENGYAAWDRRDEFKMHNDTAAFKEAVEKEFGGFEISGYTISGVDSIYSPLKGQYQVSLEGKVDQMGDMVVFNPLLSFSEDENPFKLEKRDYPVEFSYPARKRIIFSYTLPEGYTVESLPAPQRMITEDKSFQFTFSSSHIGNTIQVVHDFSLNRSMFLPQEYETVKNMFAAIVNKHSEKIVLKKTGI